jgi:hypothetical protein
MIRPSLFFLNGINGRTWAGWDSEENALASIFLMLSILLNIVSYLSLSVLLVRGLALVSG